MSPKLLVDIFSFWMVEFKGFSVKRILGRGFQLGLAKMYPLRLKAGESMLDRLIFSSTILSLNSGSFPRKDKSFSFISSDLAMYFAFFAH